ncbi:SGNH/GDSL hydrolase family protein [Neobacillus jeddahensis]|uniref:SGNH/GDSL hydrolase family protein n=1 Tax=Neobacillus jeddahensis TaxID=1461580 RepID=UPI0005913ABF|nr:SGNH/GDSL hydrolase family protein [Neobacillus jeddahensis]
MKRKKVIIMIMGLLTMCILPSLFLIDRNQAGLQTVSTVATVESEQVENTEEVASKEEEKPVEDHSIKQESPKPFTDEIKEKVREVVDSVVDFFEKDQKIVAIGDSLTEGVGDETKSGGYVGILNHTFEDHNLSIKIENFGKKGNRSDQLLKRLENKEIATAISKADIVLITIGANDIMKVLKSNFTNLTLEPFQVERVEYTERVTDIFNRLKELNPDAHIYLIGFYNPFERQFANIKELDMIIDNWNEAGNSITEEYENVSFVPTEDIFTNSTVNLLAADQFHPNTKGYKLIAQRVLEYLKVTEETSVAKTN